MAGDTGWQPIATAPKDQRVLVVLKPHPLQTEGEITFAYFVGDVWTFDETGEVANPTHWLPLPAPPKDDFLPGWRDEASEITRLKSQVDAARKEYEGWLPTAENINALPEPLRQRERVQPIRHKDCGGTVSVLPPEGTDHDCEFYCDKCHQHIEWFDFDADAETVRLVIVRAGQVAALDAAAQGEKP